MCIYMFFSFITRHLITFVHANIIKKTYNLCIYIFNDLIKYENIQMSLEKRSRI